MEVSGYFEYTIDPVSGEKVKVAAESKLVEMVEENIRKAPKMDAVLSVLAGVPLEELDVPLEVPNVPLAQKKKKRKQKRPARAIVTDESFLAGLEQNLHDKLTIDLKEKRAAAAQRIGNPELAKLHEAKFVKNIKQAKEIRKQTNAKQKKEKLETVPLCTRLANEFIANNPDPSTRAAARKKEEEELDAFFAKMEASFREQMSKPENRKLSPRTAERLAKRMEELKRMEENGEEEDW